MRSPASKLNPDKKSKQKLINDNVVQVNEIYYGESQLWQMLRLKSKDFEDNFNHNELIDNQFD